MTDTAGSDDVTIVPRAIGAGVAKPDAASRAGGGVLRGVDPLRPFANDQPDAIRSAFDTLRQSIDPAVISVLQTLVSEGRDADLARINPLSLARDCGLGEDSVVPALLHATRLGLVDMVWNILCPSCRGNARQQREAAGPAS